MIGRDHCVFFPTRKVGAPGICMRFEIGEVYELPGI